MIVLDGSGSMWGRLGNEKQPKLALAREAIRLALPGLGKDARLGIATFGHRRPGDCSDVETLMRPQAFDADRVLGMLDRLNPKGRGPIALALREAARDLAAVTETGHIVLIHDDLDNCNQDPCSAAAEINRSLPRTVVHVVSLGMRPEEAERMACVARTTGGRLFDAQNATDVTNAVAAALLDAGSAPPTLVAAPSRVSRGTSAAVAHKPGLHLSVSLGSSEEPLDLPVRWRITRSDDPDGLAAYQGEAARPSVEIASGRYDIEARLGLVSTRLSVDLDAKAANRVNVPLQAGTIRLSAQGPGGGATSSDVIYSIAKPETGPGAAATGRPGDPLLILRGPQPEIALPPGPYVVSVRHGLYRVDRPIIVADGSRGKLTIPLPTGELELQAAATSDGPVLDDVMFQVFEDDPDAAQGRRELARSAASRPSFTIAAGTYYVAALRGTAEARERVTVRPGEVERRRLIVGSARLSLSAAIVGNRPDSTDSVTYLVERIDREPRSIVRTTRQGATLDLAPGKYRVESRLGLLNARAEREIELRPGAREDLILEHQAGVVRLGLIERQGALPLGDVFWEVRDEAGGIVWITNDAQPLGILRAGRYLVRAEARGHDIQRPIEIRAGDNRVVEILAQ